MTYAEEKLYLKNLLTKGAETPVDVSGYEMTLPSWADAAKLQKAQKLFNHHYFGTMSACFVGLLSVLSIPTILKVLVFTNKSSSNYTAYKRYVETIFHALTWFRTELKPGSASWKSIEAVRKLHFSASESASSSNIGIVSQKDMAITQYGFIGFIVMSGDKFGIFCTRDDFDAFVHFWRVMGHLLGIHDEFNLCAENYEKTVKQFEIVRTEVLKPAAQFPPNKFEEMTRYIVDGMWCFNPFGDYDAFIFTLKRVLDVPGYHYYAHEAKEVSPKDSELYKLGWWTRYNLFSDSIMNEFLMQYDFIRKLVNFQASIFEWFARHLPILAIYCFGFKRAFVSILNGKY